MTTAVAVIAALSSIVVRLSAYTFLRWIPGHHFPPAIVASLLVYLTTVVAYSNSFGTGRPSLREAFPKLFNHEKRHPKDDQDDIHEPFLYHDEKSLLKVLFLGIPDWKEWELSYLTIFINLLVTLLSLDLVFRAPLLHSENRLAFSRLGFVDSTTAKVLVRDPDPSHTPIYVYLRSFNDPQWQTVDTIYYLSEETDYTYPITFTNLQPHTDYKYALSNNQEGSFTTRPAPNSHRATSLTFLTSSCIKANFPYNPFSSSLTIHGFQYLSDIVTRLPTLPSFMMFLGDFIYVDVPLRLSSAQSHYRAEYRRVYASPSWSLPGLNIPWLHTLDDHEIANDWAGGNTTAPFPAASDPFLHYHVSVNPPLPPSLSNTQPTTTNTTFSEFTDGPASFFMLDTRRYRTSPEPASQPSTPLTNSAKPFYGSSSPPKPSPDTHTMLGPQQLAALLSFLRAPPAPGVHWKFISSSVPFTKNWRFGTPDTWGGFLSERSLILSAMQDAERTHGIRVIVLSGDRHEFAAIRFPPSLSDHDASTDAVDAGPHEFSVGPLSMFYLPIRTFKQTDPEDVAIKYLPDGNSKVGVVRIEPLTSKSRAAKKSRMLYTLYIDGEVVWEYALTSPADGYKGAGRWFEQGRLWN